MTICSPNLLVGRYKYQLLSIMRSFTSNELSSIILSEAGSGLKPSLQGIQGACPYFGVLTTYSQFTISLGEGIFAAI